MPGQNYNTSHDDGDLYETLKSTVIAQCNAAASPRPWDVDALMALRSSELGYHHTLHPSEALPAGFEKPMDLTTFEMLLKTMNPLVESMEIEMKSMVIDTKTRTAVVTITAVYDLVAVGDLEAVKGDRTDYVWLTEMDKTGTKIVRMEEFLNLERLVRKGGLLERSQKLAAIAAERK